MIKYVVLYSLAVLMAAIAQLLLKISSNRHVERRLSNYLNTLVITAYSLLLFSTCLVVIALKEISFKYVPAIEALGYIYAFLLGVFFLGEKASKNKIIGITVIIIGIIVFRL